MATMQKKNFATPDETRSHPKMKVEVVNAGGTEVLKVTFEPGWKWDDHLKPSAGTKSCEVTHLNYVLSGQMHLKMDDGTEFDVGPGDVVSLPAGHTAWVVGADPVVWIDVLGGKTFAK